MPAPPRQPLVPILALVNSTIFSLIIGFVTVLTAGKGFSQSTNVLHYIKVDLEMQSDTCDE